MWGQVGAIAAQRTGVRSFSVSTEIVLIMPSSPTIVISSGTEPMANPFEIANLGGLSLEMLALQRELKQLEQDTKVSPVRLDLGDRRSPFISDIWYWYSSTGCIVLP